MRIIFYKYHPSMGEVVLGHGEFDSIPRVLNVQAAMQHRAQGYVVRYRVEGEGQ